MILALTLQVAAFSCTPALIYDVDTLTCADGTKLRLAGANGQELKGNPCPPGFPCPPMSAKEARLVLVRHLNAKVIGKHRAGHLIVRGMSFRYRVVGRNRDRKVAVWTLPSGADARCTLIAEGALANWPEFVREYRLEPCRG